MKTLFQTPSKTSPPSSKMADERTIQQVASKVGICRGILQPVIKKTWFQTPLETSSASSPSGDSSKTADLSSPDVQPISGTSQVTIQAFCDLRFTGRRLVLILYFLGHDSHAASSMQAP